MQSLSHVRNICAQFGRLYDKKLTFKPKLFKEEQKQFNNQYIFSDIYIIERLITIEEGTTFLTELRE